MVLAALLPPRLTATLIQHSGRLHSSCKRPVHFRELYQIPVTLYLPGGDNTPRRKLFRKYGVKAVVERASTQDLRGGGRIVTQACEYMRLNAGMRINVDDVAKRLRISRRTLEMRFGEILGKGVADVLRAERLARVCRLLKETNRTIADISFDSGFASPTHLKALFKKTYGMTMADWREHQ